MFALGLLLLLTPAADPPRLDAYGDPLPAGAVARFGTGRYRTAAETLALSPDGTRVATVANRCVTVWDLATGRALYRIRDPWIQRYASRLVRSYRPMAFAADGKQLLVAMGHDLRVYDAASGEQTKRIDFHAAVAAVAAQFPGAFAVTAGPTLGKAVVTGRQGWAVVVDYAGASKPVVWQTPARLPVVNATGTRAAGLDVHGNVTIMDTATGIAVGSYNAGIKPNVYAMSPAGDLLAVSSTDGVLRVLDAVTGTKLTEFGGPADHDLRYVERLAFSADGRRLVVGCTISVRQFELKTGAELPPCRPTAVGYTTGVAVTADGKTIVGTSTSGVIDRWDAATGKLLPPGDGWTDNLHAAVSPDGRRLAAADGTGKLQVWDAPFDRPARTLAPPGGGPKQGVAWFPDSKRFLTVDSKAVTTAWDAAAGTPGPPVPLEMTANKNMNYGIFHFGITPDGSRVFADTNYLDLRGWDAATGQRKWMQRGSYAGASADRRTLIIKDLNTTAPLQEIDAGFRGKSCTVAKMTAMRFAEDFLKRAL